MVINDNVGEGRGKYIFSNPPMFAARQTGQQCLLGAYSGMMRQVGKGTVTMYPRRDVLEVVVVDGKARGVI